MLYIGVLKRVLPFVLTFAAGLFIASFFVSIATPSLNFPRRSQKFREIHRLRDENQQLKRSNMELRKQVEDMRNSSMTVIGDANFPAFELDVPQPPPPPRAPHHPRFDK